MIAKLYNGRTIEYYPEIIGEGATKQAYLTKDNQSVICFYKNNIPRLTRLQKILTVFNPTLNNKYWQELFCWPTDIVLEPKIGIVMPVYPNNFLFKNGRWQGKPKKSRWFISSKLCNYLPITEPGSWIDYFKICILLARAVNRLHLSGLAHSDLSDNNILIDPTTGKILITDIDSLIVPQIFVPEVNGTPGYIAPEVLATIESPINDKNLANINTDQHALAVLIYELLLNRHPLRGPKVNSINSAEEDEYLSMGEQALFIEHPTDFSNHLSTDKPLTILGPTLTKLFYQAFVTGLHSPHLRPTAYQWEKALITTWEQLYPCSNCNKSWFIITNSHCSFCKTPIDKPVFTLTVLSQKLPNKWLPIDEIVIYDGKCLFAWHVFDNIFPTYFADKTPLAYCAFHQGKWLLVNQLLTSMALSTGKSVAINTAIELKIGMEIHLSQEAHGCIIKVNKFIDYSISRLNRLQ
ncbi:hypothetical protein QUF74_09300 [Candidatus Halobeggiatoa sp. HSG11]|nr:hypothetical protein [Candidatus Halobeggiatoa sp. HSG11]